MARFHIHKLSILPRDGQISKSINAFYTKEVTLDITVVQYSPDNGIGKSFFGDPRGYIPTFRLKALCNLKGTTFSALKTSVLLKTLFSLKFSFCYRYMNPQADFKLKSSTHFGPN